MSTSERLPSSGADRVNLSTTLELLGSLTQYAEAGAVQPRTLAQAAEHALEEHGSHLDILLAVARLYRVSGKPSEALNVLHRADELFPDSGRVTLAYEENGFEASHPAPTERSVELTPAPTADTSIRRRNEPVSTARADSQKTPVSIRSAADLDRQRSRRSDPGSPPEQDAPSSVIKKSATGATTKMHRVAKPLPERSRWGRGKAREPFDSRPDREPAPVEEPKSVRARPKGAPFRELVHTPASPMPRIKRAKPPGSARVATLSLKMLAPDDEQRWLDRYELIGEIASGGMATVYLARLAGVAGFQRFFAIKRLHPHLADEQEFIDGFLDEARLAAGIHHPNVVPILEVGTGEDGYYYLVMDYIEGDTLSGVIARAATVRLLPRPMAFRIVIDALHGLHAAHELTDVDGVPLELVHRDCSPQNILVGVDGASRLTDFGIARASARLSNSQSISVKGKVAYLSPEQATGQRLDRRSDIFSMGIILWEILAGCRLFKAETDAVTLSRILLGPVLPLSDYAPDIPEGVIKVVSTALQKAPEDRFATAADMADALDGAVRGAGYPDMFVASPRDVAGYMRELFSEDIAARRDTVRNWILCSDSGDSSPRSQGGRRSYPGAPLSARGRALRDSDTGPTSSHDPLDAPATQREGSPLRDSAPAPLPEAAQVAKPAPEAPPPAPVEPDPVEESDAGGDDNRAALAPPVASSDPKPKVKSLPVPLIALTLVVVLGAIAAWVVRLIQ